jgi:membrane protease YdiL (CAAX protease family)
MSKDTSELAIGGKDREPSQQSTTKQWGPFAAIWYGILVFLGPQLIVGEVVYLLNFQMQDTDLESFYMYGISVAITFILLSQLLRRKYGSSFFKIGLNKFRPRYIGYALLALPCYLILSSVFSDIVAAVYHNFNSGQQQNLGFTSVVNPIQVIAVFVSLVIIPPLVEESVFRGFLFMGLRKKLNPWWAAIVTSLIFGVAHWQLNVSVDTFALSLALCYLRIKTDSLWPGIFLHATKNFIAFVFVFIMTPGHLLHLF